MTVHMCRDLVMGGPVGFATGSYDTMWAAAVFLQGVLNYKFQSSAGSLQPPAYADLVVNYYSASLSNNSLSLISSSILSIKSASCFISASGPHTLLKFSTDSVNLLSAAYPVGWPSGSGAWPALVGAALVGGAGDPFLGDWVAIRSTANPLANSGIFAVKNSTLWLSGNAIELDYRSTSSTIQETVQFVTTSFWTPPPGSDTGTATNRGSSRTGNYPTFAALAGNGNINAYQGNGGSTYPRMILTSPSTLGWQVRLALETSFDRNFGGRVASGPAFTAIPGFSGSGGDFPTRSFAPGSMVYHLHAPQWFNTSSILFAGTMPGVDRIILPTAGVTNLSPTTCSYRFYAWGNDVAGTAAFFVRNIVGAEDCFCIFGQPENETVPTPKLEIQRLFVIGQLDHGQGVDWKSGPFLAGAISGMAFSLDRRLGPVSSNFSAYSYVAAQSTNAGSIRYDADAADTPFLKATELVGVDVVAGAWDNQYSPGSIVVLNVEPRRMGQVPFARFGRSTGQATWATADTSMLWFHITNGVYLPWGGVVGL